MLLLTPSRDAISLDLNPKSNENLSWPFEIIKRGLYLSLVPVICAWNETLDWLKSSFCFTLSHNFHGFVSDGHYSFSRWNEITVTHNCTTSEGGIVENHSDKSFIQSNRLYHLHVCPISSNSKVIVLSTIPPTLVIIGINYWKCRKIYSSQDCSWVSCCQAPIHLPNIIQRSCIP